MADKHIGALPASPAVYDDTLFVAEQQGTAVKITGRQLKSMIGTGDVSGFGFVEMVSSIPPASRYDNTLYGLILEEYGG